MQVRIALRNLGRNTRRTVITLVSISFGLMLALIFIGIGDSQYAKLIDGATKLGWGHFSVLPREYLDFPSLSKTIAPVEPLLESLRNDPDVAGAVERIAGEAMLSTARESVGIGFIALDPEMETADTLLVLGHIIEGGLFASDDTKGVVLGRKTADSLGVKIGDKVVYTCTDRHGEIVSSLAWVRGIYQTGSDQVDRFLAILPIEKVRSLAGFEDDETTYIAAFCKDINRVERIRNRFAKKAAFEPFDISPWNKTAPDMAGIISIDRAFNYLFQVIVFLLIAAGILNTILMSVLERTREFGVMIALGMSPGRLFRLVMIEAFWLSVFGIILGLLLTAPIHWWLHTSGWDFSSYMGETDIAGVIYDPVVYSDLRAISLVVIISAAFVMIMLAGVYPAWKAGRTVPVESLKHIG
jgi:ABC-type lipoprotein release transport system permease subunit